MQAINKTERYASMVVSLIVISFFAYDIAIDFSEGETNSPHFYIELSLVILMAALVVYQLERNLSTQIKLQSATKKLNSIQGEVATAIDQQLSDWVLSPAEKEVAWFMIKGFSFQEIAGFRSVAEKTIHQQAANVYQKAGVGSRHELISGFLEDFVSSG